MAYDTKSMVAVTPRMGLGDGTDSDAGRASALWTYRTDDDNTACVATDYISDAKAKGMLVGDQVLAIIDEDGTPALAHYRLSAIDSDGNGTLVA